MVDFSIILVNFNGMDYLPRCLDAIRKQEFDGSWEIIAVNNYSTDNSVEWLRNQNDVKVLDFGKNLGFSVANNIGISQAKGEFILCLNFDCFLTPRFLLEVYDAFCEYPDVGMVSGKLYKLVDYNFSNWLDTTGIEFIRCFPKDRGEWEVDSGQYDTQLDIFGPSGAAGCYRRNALEDVKFGENEYFDKEMFIYVEDIDLSWRLNLAGWKGRYLPQAIAYHKRGSTREKVKIEKINYFTVGFSNRFYTMLKNLRWKNEIEPFWKIIISQEIQFYISWSKYSPHKHIIYFFSIFRFLKLIVPQKTWKKRKLIQNNIKNDSFNLGFNYALIKESHTPSHDYNLIEKIDLDDYQQIFEMSSEHMNLINIIEQPSVDGELIRGLSKSNDPQIIIKLPDFMKEKLSNSFLHLGLFMKEKDVGQLITFDKECRHAISDNILLNKGYNEYFFSIGKMPLAPVGSPSFWANNCEILRFDPAIRKNVMFAIKYLRIYTKK
ncbi:MAG: glycosyltransferase family 2 protein [Candidatus Methanoperedens sp.]|nr:glycosyltransferase family 2 protein [Candidatus Methanoperedens sp.]